MTIVYEGPGDIFTSGAQTLVCPVNTTGAMGAGLAMAFRNRCPGLYDAYRRVCYTKELTTESLFLYKPEGGGANVLCLPTKGDWKDDSKLPQVDAILRKLSEEYEELGITSLAFPPVGCGLGRLDYVLNLKPLLYRYFDPVNIPVKIVFGKGTPSRAVFD